VALLTLAGCGTPAVPAASPTPSDSVTQPPLAADLAGGVAISLGGEGHWAIRGDRAYLADADGLRAIDLASGATAWEASFPAGQQPWDADPTVAVSADGATVHALRTVDAAAGGALELLSLDAAEGTVTGSRLVSDPSGTWRVDLPPRILAADEAGLVLADNPESGYQVGSVALPAAEFTWSAEDQGFAADAAVITRSGARDRRTGSPLWQASFSLGPLVASTDAVVVAGDGAGRVVWLDAGTGAERAAVEADPESCAVAETVVVCLAEGTAGYDLSSGEQLWSQAEASEAVTAYRDWSYLWRSETAGDVLDARTGEVIVRDSELPQIRLSTEAGVLVDRADGSAWVAIS
jgi:hypothetical protein